jgi:hypothetical protein
LLKENSIKEGKIIAEAIVIKCDIQKLTANLYMRCLEFTYPIQFFTDRNKAEQWLREQTEN